MTVVVGSDPLPRRARYAAIPQTGAPIGADLSPAVEVFVLLGGGMLGARYGASRVILWGGVASAVVSVPAFLLFESGQPVLVVIAMTLAVGTLSLPYAASGTVMTGLFPANTRYTGV